MGAILSHSTIPFVGGVFGPAQFLGPGLLLRREAARLEVEAEHVGQAARQGVHCLPE